MLQLQHVGYHHPNKDLLFQDISLSVQQQDKLALIGNNGAGKSTLLRLMAGELLPSSGHISSDARICYIPQVYGQYQDHSIAAALGIADKLRALEAILEGHITEDNYALLDDDWSIEVRCREALSAWGLDDIDLSQKMHTLSGGQKTKVFLSRILIHDPQIVLLDEPGNHLDLSARQRLYDYIGHTHHALVVVSHDRTLLNLLDTMCELGPEGLSIYGGNYDSYKIQKAVMMQAAAEELSGQEKALRKARAAERESLERQQKLDARGKKKQEQAGLPTISMNTLRNNAEKSTSRLKEVHAEKTNAIAQDINRLRQSMPDKDKMKIGFAASGLHKGKILIRAEAINYRYNKGLIWEQALNFGISSGQRLAIKGDNGSGKTTLIHILLGKLQPVSGRIYRAMTRAIYLDQDYSLIGDTITVLEQAQLFNTAHLQEHEVRSRLTRFLFSKKDWDKPCSALSGGEKMRLSLCCLGLEADAPDMIILDEPTNNLDIQNTELLTHAIKDYQGTLIVISHDQYFSEQIGITQTLSLGRAGGSYAEHISP